MMSDPSNINMDHPKTVLIIQTGGTIDKDYPRTRLGYSFEIGEAAACRILKRVKACFSVETITVCRKDSQDITDKDREQLLQACQSTPHRHVIITHGTDTLLLTASYLAQCSLPQDQTLVLTGSFKPETFKDSDAEFNVGVAVGALQGGMKPGVYVAMNAGVHAWDQVLRDPQTDMFVAKS